MSGRFSQSYIRQQPEYRYLVNKDTDHVIQTCFEDGQVKLRFGHKQDPPQDDTVRLPKRPPGHKGGSSTSSSLSHSSVYHLTGRGYHGMDNKMGGQGKYDPKVERSQSYMHQKGNSFNKASQYLTPVRSGVHNLQVHYSQTNTAHNDGLIFAHLLRASHVRNALVEEGVYALERRLYSRRHGHSPHATTFYDMPTTDNGKAKTRRKNSRTKTVYGTVANKKKQRDERIKKKNEEIEMGYTPRALSLTPLGPEDMDLLLQQCRHLRVDPHRQQHLYRTDREFWDSVMCGEQQQALKSVIGGNDTSTPRSPPTGKV
nr:hypothetical protein BaRGS_007468 [Batillaria attramentaria]